MEIDEDYDICTVKDKEYYDNVWLYDNINNILDIYDELVYIYPYIFNNIKSTDFTDFIIECISTHNNIIIINNNNNNYKYCTFIKEYKYEISIIAYNINKFYNHCDISKIKYFLFSKI